MFLSQINWLAVAVCGVVSLVVGGIWYGGVFRNTWISLVNKTEEELAAMQKDAAKGYIMAVIGAMFTGTVLAYIAIGVNSHTILGALMMGFFVWLGIAVPLRYNNVIFEKRPFKLFAVNSGFELTQLLVQSIIVSLWR